jgi:hypothetical protein
MTCEHASFLLSLCTVMIELFLPAQTLLQNFFLYFYGLVFNAVAVTVACIATRQTFSTLIVAGQSPITMLLIANNAAQVQYCTWLLFVLHNHALQINAHANT